MIKFSKTVIQFGNDIIEFCSHILFPIFLFIGFIFFIFTIGGFILFLIFALPSVFIWFFLSFFNYIFNLGYETKELFMFSYIITIVIFILDIFLSNINITVKKIITYKNSKE